MDKLENNLIWKILLRVQEIIIFVTGCLCVLIFVAEVACRYIFKIDFLGFDEWVLLFAIWLYFIGGAYCMYKREHISADMMSLFLKGRKLDFAHMVASWLVLIITIIICIWAVDFVQYAMSRPANTTVWRIPKLCGQIAVCIGYFLMAFYAFVYAVKDTFTAFRKRPEEPAPQEETALEGGDAA
ncbi:MAG: TRAP transporter small permease [Firmicutes bacterium]|nr:TRAP transporter small permease [Bacillota bacterium]MBQ3964103.1 TRAP transporter small permease [Bacillota bacterium]